MGKRLAGEGGRAGGRGEDGSGNPGDSEDGSAENGGNETGRIGEIEIKGEGLSGLASVAAQDKRGRGRPRKDGGVPEPGKAPAAKSGRAGTPKYDRKQTEFMISSLLSTGFSITAARLGDHWKLSKDEAEALAEPVAAIMERHDLTEKTGAYGDYIALLVAVCMIIVPKALAHMDKNKAKGGLQLVRQTNGTLPSGTARQPAEGSNAAAGQADDSNRSIQQSDPVYRPSALKQSLAHITG